MKAGYSIIVIVVVFAAPLSASTCRAPKNPLPAQVLCGRVQDQTGEEVPNVELQLLSNKAVVAKANSDVKGNFAFAPIADGEYELITSTPGWHLFWPIKITSSGSKQVCKQPATVVLSITACGSSVSKRGYRPRF